MQRLIGLTGQAGCGKDTVARILMKNHDFSSIAFADPIRIGAAAIFGAWTDDRADKEATIEWIGKSPREIMQLLGTEFGRELIHPDIWIRALERRLAVRTNQGPNFVVTDCRFQNEANWIRDQGGQLWHIQRRSAEPVASHVSENGLAFDAGYCHLLDNNGDFQDLSAAVDRLMNSTRLPCRDSI